ncbi:TrmH family RNA methyltransferase [Salinimonas lutimaris]|uniref:TrmH family RNA methyltransferase n=1 Tax=Salinimonas lutimaris TaxID=914153 RepID=UPI0010C04B06|nr:RNA methyltransferase [Salinimonas lutimaris]
MKFDDVKKLHQKKYRTQSGYYLVEGEHLVLELCKVIDEQSARGITLFVTDEHTQWVASLPFAFSVKQINSRQMSQLSDTTSPQGIVACVPINLPISQAFAQTTNYIYLHEVQDPGNLGTILRSLAWFGAFKLLLSPNSVDPYNSKVVRASMGAIFHVDVETDVPLDTLAQRFSRFAYLDMNGASISQPAFSNYDCYLFGNEARGVPTRALETMQADPFTINGSGKIDSLNLASAVNICVYQLSVS